MAIQPPLFVNDFFPLRLPSPFCSLSSPGFCNRWVNPGSFPPPSSPFLLPPRVFIFHLVGCGYDLKAPFPYWDRSQLLRFTMFDDLPWLVLFYLLNGVAIFSPFLPTFFFWTAVLLSTFSLRPTPHFSDITSQSVLDLPLLSSNFNFFPLHQSRKGIAPTQLFSFRETDLALMTPPPGEVLLHTRYLFYFMFLRHFSTVFIAPKPLHPRISPRFLYDFSDPLRALLSSLKTPFLPTA